MNSATLAIAFLAAGLSYGQIARKLLELPLMEAGEISQAGRYVPYIEKNNLWLVDTLAGMRKQLTDLPNGHRVGYSTISPDEKHVAYRHSATDIPCEVRLIKRDGGASRVLFANEILRECWPVSWTPDGKSVLVATTNRGESLRRLELVQVKDGSSRKIPLKTGIRVTEAAFSSDGRWLAFTDSAQSRRAGRVTLLSVATGEVRPLTKTEAKERLAGWRNDGRVYFTSDAMGDPALFAIAVVDGQPRGEPALIRKNV